MNHPANHDLARPTDLTRRELLSLGALAAVVPATLVRAAAAGAATSSWTPIFDGQSLAGWRPAPKSPHSRASANKTAGRWVVEGGAIVGSQDTPNNGGLLFTEAQYGDVEISVETNNDFGPDSGIFLRCTEEGRGYQCLIDYHPAGTIGGILGEQIWKRRGERNFTFGAKPEIITLNPHAQPCPVVPEAWPFFWRVGQWNEVRVRIVGDPPTITTWINGVQILTFTEPVSQHPVRGHVGLQVHGGAGNAGFVRYRNLRVRSV